MKEERYAYSTVQYKPLVAAAMTVLLQHDLDKNSRNSYFIVGVVITYFAYISFHSSTYFFN